MFEVKGRAVVFWYWAGVGAVLALVGLGIWDWFKDEGFLLRVLPVSLVGSGLVFLAIGIWKVLDTRPVIVVDDKGLLDRTALPARLIAWNDIVQFRLITDAGREPSWLAIDLAEPAKLISKATFGGSAILEALEKKYGTPCVIAVKTLEIEPHNLLERCKGAMKEFKR